jgi:hypothetical protein
VEADGRCRSTAVAVTESCRSTVAAATESFSLSSAPYVISSAVRVCGVLCGTTNVGSRPPAYPFYMALYERGPLP